MDNILQVGAITKTHGVHGEVKVYPMTDDVARFKKLKSVLLDTGKGMIELKIEGVKFFKQFVIVKFADHNLIEDVEKYCGHGIYVTRENAVKLKKDEYFIADLIGLKVFDEENNEIGELKDVIQTGANDVYEIALSDGRDLLLPAIKECILNVDVEAGSIMIHILDGLLD